MIQLTLILDNLRSTANVGSILRSADSFGVQQVITCGSTPYPKLPNDDRDPVVVNRNTRSIGRSALGAEVSVKVEHMVSSIQAIEHLRRNGWTIYGLEQAPHSTPLQSNFEIPAKLALVVGSEVEGLSPTVMQTCDRLLEIDQLGNKESLNVAVATGIALFRLRSLGS